ncbi:MAG: hypothetical protein IT186_04405 [Acidobacteria bacterium]|nr:hypothetical protein [Acidobacteriota bacterium]
MSDEVVETLKLIWGEMKALNSRAERTNTELSRTNERLDRTNDRLERLEATTNERLTSLEGRVQGMSSRLVEVEMRLTTEVIALAAIMKDIRDSLLTAGQTRMNQLDDRLTRLERKVG